MKKFLIAWGIILIVIVFQTSLLAPWFPDHDYPDMPLMLLASLAIIFGFQLIWFWAIIAGLTLDFFSYSKIGAHVIVFILAIYLASFISRRFSIGGKGIGMIFVMILMPIITALDYWGTQLLNNWITADRLFVFKSAGSIGVMTLENTILFFVFYALILGIKKFYGPIQYHVD